MSSCPSGITPGELPLYPARSRYETQASVERAGVYLPSGHRWVGKGKKRVEMPISVQGRGGGDEAIGGLQQHSGGWGRPGLEASWASFRPLPACCCWDLVKQGVCCSVLIQDFSPCRLFRSGVPPAVATQPPRPGGEEARGRGCPSPPAGTAQHPGPRLPPLPVTVGGGRGPVFPFTCSRCLFLSCRALVCSG